MLPPGPASLPIFGNLFSLSRQPYKDFLRLKKRYGDVFSIQIGNKPAVVFNGLHTIKKALRQEELNGRPKFHSFQHVSDGKSLAFNDLDHIGKIHRRLAENAIKILTDEKEFPMASVANRGAESLTDRLLSKCGTEVNLYEDIYWGVASVHYEICFGFEKKHVEPLSKLASSIVDFQSNGIVSDFMPLAAKVFSRQDQRYATMCSSMLSTCRRIEYVHLDTYNTEKVRDAIDALIKASAKLKPAHQEVFEMERLLDTTQDFLVQGWTSWQVLLPGHWYMLPCTPNHSPAFKWRSMT